MRPNNPEKPVVAFVIPAYEPMNDLAEVVSALRSLSDFPIIVVDDGSNPSHACLFESLKSTSKAIILRHAINLGKGSALKTAFNHALCEYPRLIGAVTLDADGQHRAEDALKVADALTRRQSGLILGCRRFSRDQAMPLRNRLGNQMTKKIFKTLLGTEVSDTQTGLRGIPSKLLKIMIRVPSSGYEFETDMLVKAVANHIEIEEVQIPTIYIDGNASSHFNPLRDSIRIYFVFIRFAFISVTSALIDFIVFALVHRSSASILYASATGRAISATFNFFASRRLVFRSPRHWVPEALRYTALVVFFLLLSNAAINLLVHRFNSNVYAAKLAVETSLFLLSFSVQRLLIFPVSKRKLPDHSATEETPPFESPS